MAGGRWVGSKGVMGPLPEVLRGLPKDGTDGTLAPHHLPPFVLGTAGLAGPPLPPTPHEISPCRRRGKKDPTHRRFRGFPLSHAILVPYRGGGGVCVGSVGNDAKCQKYKLRAELAARSLVQGGHSALRCRTGTGIRPRLAAGFSGNARKKQQLEMGKSCEGWDTLYLWRDLFRPGEEVAAPPWGHLDLRRKGGSVIWRSLQVLDRVGEMRVSLGVRRRGCDAGARFFYCGLELLRNASSQRGVCSRFPGEVLFAVHSRESCQPGLIRPQAQR